MAESTGLFMGWYGYPSGICTAPAHRQRDVARQHHMSERSATHAFRNAPFTAATDWLDAKRHAPHLMTHARHSLTESSGSQGQTRYLRTDRRHVRLGFRV
eukprot:2931374-Rhodomonas_salina.2